MLLEAQKKFGIDMKKSWMVGDSTRDILAGTTAGCKTILVKTGFAGSDNKYEVNPNYVCNDILDAAELIAEKEEIKAVIVAGGLGTRLKPLTNNLPKPMLPIGGKPILERQIELLKKYGVTDIVICGFYLFDKIKEYFGSGENFGVKITYIKDPELDTGGSLKLAEKFISNTFIVFYGDTVIEMDLKKMIDFHREKGGIATVVLHKTDHPHDSDLVEIDRNQRIIKLYRKPHNCESDLAKSSIYVLEKDIFGYIPEGRHSFHGDDLPKLIEMGNVYGYVTGEFIKDIGTLDRYDSVRKKFE